MCPGENFLHVDVSEHLHVHMMMNGGPRVNEADILHLSIPPCQNESLRTDGNKTPSLTPGNASHGTTESKMREATIDLKKNILLFS